MFQLAHRPFIVYSYSLLRPRRRPTLLCHTLAMQLPALVYALVWITFALGAVHAASLVWTCWSCRKALRELRKEEGCLVTFTLMTMTFLAAGAMFVLIIMETAGIHLGQSLYVVAVLLSNSSAVSTSMSINGQTDIKQSTCAALRQLMFKRHKKVPRLIDNRWFIPAVYAISITLSLCSLIPTQFHQTAIWLHAASYTITRMLYTATLAITRREILIHMIGIQMVPFILAWALPVFVLESLLVSIRSTPTYRSLTQEGASGDHSYPCRFICTPM